MRLFLAIELPEPARDHLVTVQAAVRPTLPHLRYTAPQNLHLTLKFLGDVADANLPALVAAMNPIPVLPQVNLHADALLTFPPRGPVRIVGASLAGDTARLLTFQGQVEDACASLGFPRESRPFRPHITLARSPDRPRAREVPALAHLFPGPPFTVTSLTLMRSDLNPAGAIYTPIAHFPPGSSAQIPLCP